jgi:hypothetical protein
MLAGNAVMGPFQKALGLGGPQVTFHGKEVLESEALQITLNAIQALQCGLQAPIIFTGLAEGASDFLAC